MSGETPRVSLTPEERETLSDWWLSGSEGDLFAVVERILASRRESLAERVKALAGEWERDEAYACRDASACVRCVSFQRAVIRLRALLDPSETP